MERYGDAVCPTENRREGAFVPLSPLAIRDRSSRWKIIDALIEGGADALELWDPFLRPRWRTA